MTVARLVDPAIEIVARIERGRARLRRERSAVPRYPVYEGGELLGAVRDPKGTPRFGPAAPTVLLRKTGSGEMEAGAVMRGSAAGQEVA